MDVDLGMDRWDLSLPKLKDQYIKWIWLFNNKYWTFFKMEIFYILCDFCVNWFASLQTTKLFYLCVFCCNILQSDWQQCRQIINKKETGVSGQVKWVIFIYITLYKVLTIEIVSKLLYRDEQENNESIQTESFSKEQLLFEIVKTFFNLAKDFCHFWPI